MTEGWAGWVGKLCPPDNTSGCAVGVGSLLYLVAVLMLVVSA